MAGKRQLATLAVAVAVLGAVTHPVTAQEVERVKQQGNPNPGKRREAMSPEFDDVRKAIEALTPDQRKRFQENFRRWSNMSVGEKKALRDRDETRRQRIAEEITAALRETGLELDKDRREQFAKRYAQERRKIEEQIRRDMEEKRRPLVKEMVGRLKAEFSEPSPATP